jgi:hypothetical protein
LVITELAKKNSTMAAIFASLPLVSILLMVIIYKSKEPATVLNFSREIAWLVLPSITMFVAFPLLIKLELSFYFALALSMALTVISYLLTNQIKLLMSS